MKLKEATEEEMMWKEGKLEEAEMDEEEMQKEGKARVVLREREREEVVER